MKTLFSVERNTSLLLPVLEATLGQEARDDARAGGPICGWCHLQGSGQTCTEFREMYRYILHAQYNSLQTL